MLESAWLAWAWACSFFVSSIREDFLSDEMKGAAHSVGEQDLSIYLVMGWGLGSMVGSGQMLYIT